MKPHIKNQVTNIPAKPGIYKFLDTAGQILYVGKAINLKSRVTSYFSSDHRDRPYIAHMIPLIENIETIPTVNEIEALILESNLIKKHSPKFNKSLKDDKSYAWIYINTYDAFPKVIKTRDTEKRGRYFGPYPDGRPINRMLKYLRTLYPFANCNLRFFPKRDPSKIKTSRICLYYHLGQCSGPCDNLISSIEYKKSINNIIKTLDGKKKSQIKELEDKMYNLAKNQEFEKAAVLRDKIGDLKYLSQRIDINLGDTEEDFRQIRDERFFAGLKEIVSKLGLNIPEHKIKNMRIECYDISNLQQQIAYGSMSVSMGNNIKPSNYRIFKIKYPESTDDTSMLKEVLQRRLKYISDGKNESRVEENIQEDGLKSSKTNIGKESLLEKPDLILIDGGKGQLSVVTSVVPQSIAILGISKGKNLKRAGKKQVDEFWKVINRDEVDNQKELNIEVSSKSSSASTKSDRSPYLIRKINLTNPYIFQNLRDEAHRFAIKHHRKGRKFLQTKSVLDSIAGVGAKRKNALMREFKTVENIKKANFEEINKVVRSEKVAKEIVRVLRTGQT